MKLTFWGAARTVTGSRHLLEVNGSRILFDCGLFQGRRSETYERNLNFPFDPAGIDLLILSHAHIDHSGNIPNLVKAGFRGDIICTPATRDLCATMLLDSGHIQERDVEFVNKRRRRKGEPPVEPLYTQQDAIDAMQNFTTQTYYRRRLIAPGIWLTFHDAGHMLGSAIVQLDIEVDSGPPRRIVFSGDIGRAGIPIIRDPDTIDGADYLIMESTYGNREHESVVDAEEHLQKVVLDAYQRGGATIMPAFAVGRTQQIVYTLHKLSESGDIPRLPIFVDSPLAVDTTAVFTLHPEVYDDEIRAFMMIPGNRNPFGFNDLTLIRSVEESKQLNFFKDPCVIISASGMVEFGRILHHLRNRIEDARNTVLITGWQAPNTLGRRLVEKQPQVRIFGEEYTVRAHVEVINGFSGHADRNELQAWFGAMKDKPKRSFLVHGEEEAALALQKSLSNAFSVKVDVPVMGQTFELD